MIAGLAVARPTFAQDDLDEQDLTQPPTPPPSYRPELPPGGPPQFSTGTLYPARASADVRFEPNDPSLRLMALSGLMPFQEVAYVRRGWWRPRRYYVGFGAEPVYTPLCEGPCTLRLMRGPYRLALSKGDGSAVEVPGPNVITGPTVLRAHYVDRSALRTTGAVIGIVGTIGGIVMMFESGHDEEVCDASGYCHLRTEVNGALLAGGIGVFLGSAIASSILLFQRDEASITVAPLRTVGAVGHPLTDAKLARAPAQGAALALHF